MIGRLGFVPRQNKNEIQPKDDTVSQLPTDPSHKYTQVAQLADKRGSSSNTTPGKCDRKAAELQRHYSELSDDGLRREVRKFADQIQPFLDEWREARGATASFPAPNTDESVQLHIDHLDRLDAFRREFERTYRPLASTIERCILERLRHNQGNTSRSTPIRADDTPQQIVEGLSELAQRL